MSKKCYLKMISLEMLTEVSFNIKDQKKLEHTNDLTYLVRDMLRKIYWRNSREKIMALS